MASGWPPVHTVSPASVPIGEAETELGSCSLAARFSSDCHSPAAPLDKAGGVAVLVEVRAARADPLTTHAHKLKSKFVSVRGSDPATYQLAQTLAVRQHVHATCACTCINRGKEKPSPPH